MAPTKSNAEVPWTPLFCKHQLFLVHRKNVTKSLAKISAVKLVFFKIRKKGRPKNQSQNAGQLACKAACWENASLTGWMVDLGLD